MQGTPQWHQMRLGKITATRAKTAISNPRTLAASLKQELRQGVEASFSNAATEWGLNYEGAARALFCILNNVTIKQYDFIDHPRLERVGCSPDGVSDQNKLVELKCPYKRDNHLIALYNRPAFYKRHRWQIQHQLLCCQHLGVDTCTLVSFYPDEANQDNSFFPELVQYDCARNEDDQATLVHAIERVQHYMDLPLAQVA